jgi:hypothetical protein
MPGENLYHIMLYRIYLAGAGFELTTLMAIGTDCIDNCKSNNHTITTTPEKHNRTTQNLKEMNNRNPTS